MSSATSNGTRRGGRRVSPSNEAAGSAGGSGSGSGSSSRASAAIPATAASAGATATAKPAAAAAAETPAASRNNDDHEDLAGEGSNNGSTTTEGGGGSADEPGSRRAKRRRTTSGSNAAPPKSVHPTQADSDRWFTNTHIAMVVILAALFTELQERHLKSHDEDTAEDEAVLGYMQRIKDIGQEANAFTKSRVQTHLLISNTVQLCHRMAADKYCQLSKDYPPGDTSDFDYDFSTDVESGEDDDDSSWNSNRGAEGGGASSAGKSAKRASNGGGGGGASSSKKKEGVSNGKAKMRSEGGARGESDSQRQGRVRERYDAVVASLVERARWNAERPGRPRKNVITKGREVVMAIFIDSFYRQMLSIDALNHALRNLERVIAWADKVGDRPGGKNDEMELGDGLPLSKIGLANIALTPPE